MKTFFGLAYFGCVVGALMISYHILHSLMDLCKAPINMYESLMWYMVLNVSCYISGLIMAACKE